MTLQQLKYIITTAEKRNVTEAARALFISQPSLTNAIKELETEMHINIFERSNKGVSITKEGEEFLGYARQVIEQANLLEEKYSGVQHRRRDFSVSTQHYSFAVNAFVDLINEYGGEKYDFKLRETQTYEIIDDVSRLKSEIGILYLSDFNEAILKKLINQNELTFTELFTADAHVFITDTHPLADRPSVTLDDLADYPYLSFEQGEHNSFYFSEELLSTAEHSKNIRVRDRATLFNLLIGLNGYTISSGVIDQKLNGKSIIALPLDEDCSMRIGYITNKKAALTSMAEYYISALKKHI